MKTTYKILLVEDDRTLSATLTYNLEQKDWAVTCAYTFQEGMALCHDDYDLFILDVNLPDGNGFSLCREVRKTSDKPVVFFTANDMEADSIQGYDVGADDYITKPFSIAVFLRKIDVLFKRLLPQKNQRYSDGYLDVNLTGMTVSCGGQLVSLSALEFRTLQFFIENRRAVLTRQQLLQTLWDDEGDYVDEHALTMGISRLRKKIEDQDHVYIKTVYGLGYMWVGEKT